MFVVLFTYYLFRASSYQLFNHTLKRVVLDFELPVLDQDLFQYIRALFIRIGLDKPAVKVRCALIYNCQIFQ